MCISALLFGSAATATTAATSGILGVGGSFALGQAALSLGAMSALSSGAQASSQADWQARQAAADAQAEREAGEVRADKVRKAGRYQQSAARAALAAGGVEVGSGTPVKIVQQIGQDAESDAQQELLYGKRAAGRLQSSANVYDMAGDQAVTAGYVRAGGSLMASGSSFTKGWITSKSLDTSSHNPDEWF